MHGAVVGTVGLVVGVLAGCSDGDRSADPSPPSGSSTSPSAASPEPTRTATESATPTAPATTPTAAPVAFDRERALRHVRVLAGRIGPRLATGPAFREAATYVGERFAQEGYAVTRQRFPVPAGDSWGVPVDAGTSLNVVATPPGFDPRAPYVVVGAHLDTVAVAPGAEDNASGISVLLELARLAAAEPTRLPTVLVAFGAEEPRGTGDDLHHFGSRHYVAELPADARPGLRAMVSMDRVGVGGSVPVCTGGLGSTRVRDALLATAGALDIPASGCADNRASDHWSFEKAGYDVARLGSTPYADYHSAGDVPSVVGPAQLDRVGRLMWGWLRAR